MDPDPPSLRAVTIVATSEFCFVWSEVKFFLGFQDCNCLSVFQNAVVFQTSK